MPTQIAIRAPERSHLEVVKVERWDVHHERFVRPGDHDTVLCNIEHHYAAGDGMWNWGTERQYHLMGRWPYLVWFSNGTFGMVHIDALPRALANLGVEMI